MKKKINVISIVVAILIGAMSGYFVENKLTTVESSDTLVYLLEVGTYESFEDIIEIQNELKVNGVYNETVYKNNRFTIIAGINSTGIFEQKNIVDNIVDNCKVKKEYLYNYISEFSDTEFLFYNLGLEYYIASLNSTSFILSEQFVANKYVNIEIYSNVVFLKNVSDNDLLERIKIQTYKMFVENAYVN